MRSLLHSCLLLNFSQHDELRDPAMQNSDMYHNCSSPCELSIRNLNVIARLNPNSSLREAYHFGGVVSPAFKPHTSIAAMIYLVSSVFNIAACVYINSPSPSSSDKTLVNHRAILDPLSVCAPTLVSFRAVYPPQHKCQSEFPKTQDCLSRALHKSLD